MRKAKQRFVSTLLALCLIGMPVVVSAQSSKDYEQGMFNHIALQTSIGTEGVSVGLGTPIGPFFELGVGVNLMPKYSISGDMYFRNAEVYVPQMSDDGVPITGDDGNQLYTTYDLGTVKVKGDLSRITFDAKLNFYPFGGRTTFFIAGGVSVGGERMLKLTGHSDEVARIYEENKYYTDIISAIVDDSYLKMARNGDVEAKVFVNKVRPYVGVGFGRLVPRHDVGLRLEVGCHFTGRMKIYQDGNDLDYMEVIKKADDRLSKFIDKLTVYPVLKLSFTARML